MDRLKRREPEAVGASAVRQLPQVNQARALPQTVCLLLGQGGTGKTTLIRSITADSEAKPEVETLTFRIYEHSITIFRRECRIFLSDYRGQDLGILTKGVLDIERDSLVRRKDISSLLIILDICDTDSGVPRDPQAPVPDYDHIQKQVEQWNGQALNAVVGLLAEGQLRLALVLVNKFDILLLKERGEHEGRIGELLSPLCEKMRAIWPLAQIEVMFGSGNGISAIDIRNKLAFHSTAQES